MERWKERKRRKESREDRREGREWESRETEREKRRGERKRNGLLLVCKTSKISERLFFSLFSYLPFLLGLKLFPDYGWPFTHGNGHRPAPRR